VRLMAGTYRERAEQAETLAGKARTHRERRDFQEIARIWRRLAGEQDDPPETEPRTFRTD
jgi:hypothetical protein